MNAPTSPRAVSAEDRDRLREALGRFWCKAEGVGPDYVISDAGHTVLCATLGGLDPKVTAAFNEAAAPLLDRITAAEARAEGNHKGWTAALGEAQAWREEHRLATADRDRLATELAEARAENERMRAALEPFAEISPHVQNTSRRDGERVHEQFTPGGKCMTLYRKDFRRAADALTTTKGGTTDAGS